MVDNMSGEKKVCNCPHHKVVPISILIIGILVVFESLGIFSYGFSTLLVGILLIIIGGTKLNGRRCKCC